METVLRYIDRHWRIVFGVKEYVSASLEENWLHRGNFRMSSLLLKMVVTSAVDSFTLRGGSSLRHLVSLGIITVSFTFCNGE